jgi:YD repeat-containing protein
VEEPEEIVVVTVYVYYFWGEATMKITYDREVDALYIRFKEVTVTTKHLAEGIAADYDAAGRLAGIEILDAKKRLGDPEIFKQVVLEDVALGGPATAAWQLFVLPSDGVFKKDQDTHQRARLYVSSEGTR